MNPEDLAEMAFWHLSLGGDLEAWARFWRRLNDLHDEELRAVEATAAKHLPTVPVDELHDYVAQLMAYDLLEPADGAAS